MSACPPAIEEAFVTSEISEDPPSNPTIEKGATTTQKGVVSTAPPDIGDLLKKSLEEEEDATSATDEGDDVTATHEGDEASTKEIEVYVKSVASSPSTDVSSDHNVKEEQGEEEYCNDEEEENVSSEPPFPSVPTTDRDSEGNHNAPANDVEDSDGNEEQPDSALVGMLSSLVRRSLADQPREQEGENSGSRHADGGESLVDKAIQFLDEFGIAHRKRHDLPEGRTVFSFGTQLENCNLDNRLDVRESSNKLVLFYCISPLRIPEKKRQAAIEFFTRANYDLLNGCFECDLRDGEFRYKVCSGFVGAEITYETIRYMYLVASNTMSRYFGGLMQVVYCEKSPAAAIQDCEAPPSQPGASPQQ